MSQHDEKAKLTLESSSERKRKFISRAINDPAVEAALLRNQREERLSGKRRC